MTPRFLIRAGIAGVLGLMALDMAACGKQGALDRPGPLFGPLQQQRRSTARAEREAAARANGEANHNSGGTSQTNGDYSLPSDGAKDPALQPYRSNPPLGAPNQFGGNGGGGGVIPDPFNDPNRAPR
ncbi:MAG TPA: hypothetical protein VGM25_07825 [Caulobacteraceae bacterium]|jgi:hypothetical protein